MASSAVADVRGTVRVVDGDTFKMGSATIRLHGIDAPEGKQTCTRKSDGAVWRCGAWSAEQVRARYEGRRVRCQEIDRDSYGRIVGRCFLNEEEINRTLVQEGYAAAYTRYSRRYLDDEKGAIVAGRGIWSSEFTRPEDWRSAQRNAPPAAQVSSSDGCRIKGNISGSGRIYHMPGQENYDA
ncbi:MAG: thermonuclease family protein, partial [Rhodobacteraceae bacterium]|nr:thermonuclease family protein [Paracoccaceae bacterium]